MKIYPRYAIHKGEGTQMFEYAIYRSLEKEKYYFNLEKKNCGKLLQETFLVLELQQK